MPGEGPETISNDPRAEYREHCAFRAGPAAGVEPRRTTSRVRQRRLDCATEIAGPRDRTVWFELPCAGAARPKFVAPQNPAHRSDPSGAVRFGSGSAIRLTLRR